MPVQLTPNGTRGTRPPTPPKLVAKLVMPIGNLIFRAMGKKLLKLTTVGAKSGREHTVSLLYQPDGDDAWVVIASYAGAAKHPAWYYNMARNPEKIWVETGGRRRRVEAEMLTGEARANAWARMVSSWQGYAGYEQKTDRVIPVVRLRAVSGP